MRKVHLVLCLAVLLATTGVIAQEQPLVSVLTVHVQLGQQQAFETGLRDLWTEFKKAGLARPIFVSGGVGGEYSFAAQYSDWADFGVANGKIQTAYAGAPGVLGALTKTQTHTDWEMWAARPDLSHAPAAPRVADSDMTYTQVTLLRVHPEHTAAFEATLKEGMALRKKHSIGDAANTFQLAAGADAPAYAILVGAKDQADYHVQNAKNVETMGEGWQAYIAKLGPMMRNIENQPSFALPELAYQP